MGAKKWTTLEILNDLVAKGETSEAIGLLEAAIEDRVITTDELASYVRQIQNAPELNAITNLDIEAASKLFRSEGWTEMDAELWASLEDGSEAGRGKLLRLIRHAKAYAA